MSVYLREKLNKKCIIIIIIIIIIISRAPLLDLHNTGPSVLYFSLQYFNGLTECVCLLCAFAVFQFHRMWSRWSVHLHMVGIMVIKTKNKKLQEEKMKIKKRFFHFNTWHNIFFASRVSFFATVGSISIKIMQRMADLNGSRLGRTVALMCRCPTYPAEALPGQLRVTGWQTETIQEFYWWNNRLNGFSLYCVCKK